MKYKTLNDFDSVNLRWASGYFSIHLTCILGESDEFDLGNSL